MKTVIVGVVGVLLLGSLLFLQWGVPARADSDTQESLSMYMGNLQRHVHKLGLAIDNQNYDLASFYVEAVGELVKYISGSFPQYKGIQVGALMPAMLTPYMDKLSKSIEAKDWKAANPAYDTLLSAGCNGCHTATQHQFVKIVRVKTNPFPQQF